MSRAAVLSFYSDIVARLDGCLSVTTCFCACVLTSVGFFEKPGAVTHARTEHVVIGEVIGTELERLGRLQIYICLRMRALN